MGRKSPTHEFFLVNVRAHEFVRFSLSRQGSCGALLVTEFQEWTHIKHDPGNPEAKAGYGHLLMMLRRTDEGLRQIEHAVAINPLDVGNRVLYASAHIVARRFDGFSACSLANPLPGA